MITFDKEANLFHLTNKSISLWIYINSESLLETVYFGKYCERPNLSSRVKDVDNCTTQYFDQKEGIEKTFKDNFSIKSSRFEIGVHNGGDNRPAPIIVQKNNGMYDTNFQYVSHKIYKGYPKYENGPHVFGMDGDTLEILLKDEFSDVYIKYNISISSTSDVIVKNVEFINKGKSKVNILRALSMSLDLDDCEYKIHHFYGNWGNERNESVNDVIVGEQIISSNYGRSSHEDNPFVFITSKNATYDEGEVIGFNLVYSGNFKYSFYSDYLKKLRVSLGINDFDFNWVLVSGANFVCPQSIISYSSKGIDSMSQNFHKFIRNNLISYKKISQYKPIIFNSWEGCMFDFNTESILQYVDASEKIGSELFVLDDGWFGKRKDVNSSLGDWFIFEEKIDLKKVEEYVHSKKMKFGLWFEPEMVSFNSDLFRTHKEYALGVYRKHPILHRSQLVLDFSSEEVVENIFSQICKVLDYIKVDYIKWDMNRDIKEHYSLFLGDEHQGEMLHRYVLGYYSLLEKILNKYPNIMIEGCASGGGRFDLGTLYYCPQIWASDMSQPSLRMINNFNTSLGYPLSTISTHINNSIETSYKEKGYLALFGTYGYEMNPLMLTEREISEINSLINVYKNDHLSLFEEGTLYHLVSPEQHNFMAMELVNADRTKFVVIVCKKQGIRLSEKLRLKGLNESSKYKSNIGVFAGKFLQNRTLDIKLESDNLEIGFYYFEMVK